MSTTTVLTRPSEATSPVSETAVRLRLGRSPAIPHREDTGGIWWPRSLDLVAELEPLLAALNAAGCSARRVTYNLDAWQPAPRKAVIGGALVRLGGYRRLSAGVLHVTAAGTTAPLVLLVLPPSADEDVATSALGTVRSLRLDKQESS
jgi:hypothetical protein